MTGTLNALILALCLSAGSAIAGDAAGAAARLSFLIRISAPVVVDDSVRVTAARSTGSALHLVIEVAREAFEGRDAAWAAQHLSKRICAHDRLGAFVRRGGGVVPSIVDRDGSPLIELAIDDCG